MLVAGMMTCLTSTSTCSRMYLVFVEASFDTWGRLAAPVLSFIEGQTGNDDMRLDRDTDQARSGEAGRVDALDIPDCSTIMVYLSSSTAMRLYCIDMRTTVCMAD